MQAYDSLYFSFLCVCVYFSLLMEFNLLYMFTECFILYYMYVL